MNSTADAPIRKRRNSLLRLDRAEGCQGEVSRCRGGKSRIIPSPTGASQTRLCIWTSRDEINVRTAIRRGMMYTYRSGSSAHASSFGGGGPQIMSGRPTACGSAASAGQRVRCSAIGGPEDRREPSLRPFRPRREGRRSRRGRDGSPGSEPSESWKSTPRAA